MTQTDQHLVRRLEFVKYLFERAKEQSLQPEPLYAASIMQLHDASELLLTTIGEQLGIRPKNEFMSWWEVLSGKLPNGVDLPLKEKMRRLNDSRREFKHRGHLPSLFGVREMVTTVSA